MGTVADNVNPYRLLLDVIEQEMVETGCDARAAVLTLSLRHGWATPEQVHRARLARLRVIPRQLA